MALSKDFMPKTKDVSGILVGVAQIRVGKSSVRSTGTALIKAAQAVPSSTLEAVEASDGTTVNIVRPTSDANTGTAVITPSGSYTGTLDGAFIIRCKDATHVDIFAPNGYQDSNILNTALTNYSCKMASATPSGLVVTAVFTNPTAGDTYIIPVWSGSAQAKVQTGIVSPYSMFSRANESVGNVKSASFTPKMDSVKTLESGFPAEVDDRIVDKTSVSVSFEAMEYTNANLGNLKDMISALINDSEISAVPIEVVMRTKGGSQVSFWIPNASLDNLPSIAPTNDYSSFTWGLGANKMTEITDETAVYNAWLANTPIYCELGYVH